MTLAPAEDVQVSLDEAGDLDRLASDWRDLQTRSRHSFFQSWGWIECWLRHLPPNLRIGALRARQHERLVGLGLMIESTQRRRAVIQSRGIHLHESGLTSFDQFAVEHNGFLLDRAAESSARAACVRFLAGGIRAGRWDEVRLPGVPLDYEADARGTGAILVAKRLETRYVDLARVRARGGAYLDELSRNTRQHLRRSLRFFAERGVVRLHVAASAAEAHAFLDRLIALHEERWRARREQSPLSLDFVQRFHHALVDARFAAGEIQLASVAAGEIPVGYLYNFVYGGRVSFYQSGLAYEPSAHCRPGLVCHCLAIEHNLSIGADVYDFLTGDARYKQSLAADGHGLVWLVLQNGRLDFRVEDSLRRLKSRLVRGARALGRAWGRG